MVGGAGMQLLTLRVPEFHLSRPLPGEPQIIKKGYPDFVIECLGRDSNEETDDVGSCRPAEWLCSG